MDGKPANTTGGMTGGVSFEIAGDDAELFAAMYGAIGSLAFDVTFAKCHLGDGYTITELRARPDKDGGRRAFVGLVAPSTAAPKLGELYLRRLIGTKGPLVLGRSQVTVSDVLAAEAAVRRPGQTTAFAEPAAAAARAAAPDAGQPAPTPIRRPRGQQPRTDA